MATIGEQLRVAILESGETKYRIGKSAGVNQPTLHRFMVGGRGLRLDSIEALCTYLRLELAPMKGKGKARKASKRSTKATTKGGK